MIEDVASAYQTPQEVIEWYNSSEENLSQIRYEKRMVDTILAAAKVSDVNRSYQDKSSLLSVLKLKRLKKKQL